MHDPSSVPVSVVNRRVLIVDDDRDFADSLCNVLKLDGYRVRTAYDLADAAAALDDFPADVALVDIKMGEQNGLALVRDLKQRYPEVMCIIVTAYASAESAIQALQEGAYDFLCKPFYPEDLTATLERCFERITLARYREQAEITLRDRNRELETLNSRLKGIVTSIQTLSSSRTTQALYETVVQELTRNLDIRNTGLYLIEGAELVLHCAFHPGLPARITLPRDPAVFNASAFVSIADFYQEQVNGDATAKHWLPAEYPFLVFPLIADGHSALGAWALDLGKKEILSEQDQEFGLILTSFTNETVRLLGALDNVRWNEARLREIIDNSPSLIALNDLMARFVVVNRQFEAWHGRSQDDVKGRTPDEVFPPEVALLYHSQASRSRNESGVEHQQIETVFQDGSAHVLLVTKFPVRDSDNKSIGIGTIATDVTDRHHAEEQLRQAQRVEALGELTGGIAHDFNNLLAVIIGNLDLLREERGSTAKMREFLDDALSSARSGSELIRRLLAVGRRQKLQPAPTDANEMVGRLARILERTLRENIQVQPLLSDDLRPIDIDRNQLETCLLNLALNARDAMPHGGILTLETQNISISSRQMPGYELIDPGEYVMLSVTDTGTGMSAAVAEKAIQPFFTTKEASHGSGLGLSMAYGFIRQSGGFFQIESEPGEGTRVALFLPAITGQVHRTAQSTLDAEDLNGKGEQVLVVEDKPAVRKLTVTILRRLGYSVLEADKGSTGLVILRANPNVDLLLTDILLPGRSNGFDLADEAIRLRPGLKVVYMSGYANVAELQKRHATIEVDIIEKPFTKDELARKLRQVLNAHATS